MHSDEKKPPISLFHFSLSCGFLMCFSLLGYSNFFFEIPEREATPEEIARTLSVYLQVSEEEELEWEEMRESQVQIVEGMETPSENPLELSSADAYVDRSGFELGHTSALLFAETSSFTTESEVNFALNGTGFEEQPTMINRFVETKSDAVSTFSIDVDTASFTRTRDQLENHQVPDEKGIRTEEFINYFDYGYEQPKEEPFTVNMKAFQDPLRSDHHYLQVGLQAKEYTHKNRPAMNLNFLVDVSGSMSYSKKIGYAKHAMMLIVDSLREDDTVSISTYAGNTALLLEATSGKYKDRIRSVISELDSSGGTAMDAGMELAYQQAMKNFDGKKENRVIVFSDGDANIGKTSHTEILQSIQGYADQGVTLSTIGVGQGNYRDHLMEQLANKGDGNNFYLDSEEEIEALFEENFISTMITLARDVKIQMEFDPETVESYRLVGYENRDIADKDFRNDNVDAGEVGAGHTVTALYEIKVKDTEGSFATARLRYEKPGKNGKAIERVYAGPKTIQTDLHADLALLYTVANFAEILKASPYVQNLEIPQLIAYAHDYNLDKGLITMMKQASIKNQISKNDLDVIE